MKISKIVLATGNFFAWQQGQLRMHRNFQQPEHTAWEALQTSRKTAPGFKRSTHLQRTAGNWFSRFGRYFLWLMPVFLIALLGRRFSQP
jgi:hypothetical protein